MKQNKNKKKVKSQRWAQHKARAKVRNSGGPAPCRRHGGHVVLSRRPQERGSKDCGEVLGVHLVHGTLLGHLVEVDDEVFSGC